MQIVINVPDEWKGDSTIPTAGELVKLIVNGTPLPEGHGRLIDADELKEHMYACETNGRPFYIMELHEKLAVIDDAPTIIEADIEIVEDHENA